MSLPNPSIYVIVHPITPTSSLDTQVMLNKSSSNDQNALIIGSIVIIILGIAGIGTIYLLKYNKSKESIPKKDKKHLKSTITQLKYSSKKKNGFHQRELSEETLKKLEGIIEENVEQK